MATETIPGGKPATGPAGKGNKLGAWLKKNPVMAGVAGVGGLVAVYVLMKHGQANSAADAGTTGTDTTAATDPSVYGTSGDLGGYDSSGDATDIEDQLQGIQDALSNMTVASTPASTSAASSSAGGHQVNQKHTLTGAQYQWLKSHNKGAYGSAGGRYTGARGWAWLQSHPAGRVINPGGPKKKRNR